MMSELDRAYAKANEWAQRARQAGWLNDADLQRLQQIERQDADDLFSSGVPRPLLVGLFGGTGVGKSSLLNRLAGEEIARVGIKRPTSREVTLHLHQDHAIESLPPEFPLASTQVKYHQSGRRRDIAWIDMPDFDSTETSNRQLVFAWLPYIDWLIYIVSPERYRDDSGWQILRDRGHRHQWVFVFNHWDSAEPEQYAAFVADLEQAGLNEPRVLRTSCAGAYNGDEFDQLEEIVHGAIAQHGLEELKRLGMVAKMHDLERMREDFHLRLGSDDVWRAVCGRFRERSGRILQRLRQSLAWPFTLIARRFPEPRRGWRSKGGVPAPSPPDAVELREAVWGPQADSYLADLVNEAVVATGEYGLPAAPMERAVEKVAGQIPDIINTDIVSFLQQSLAKPGSAWQRGLYRLAGVLRALLPAAAVAWAGYFLVTRFQSGTTGEGEFLGLDFAIHSILLVAFAWVLPQLLHRVLEPSPRKAAHRGLEQGSAAGVARSERELTAALEELGEERQRLLEQLKD